MVLKLKDIAEPKFEIEFPDGVLPEGNKREYDPWELQEKIAENARTAKTDADHYDGIRRAFGMPTQAEANGTKFTFSRHVCWEVNAALGEFIEGLDVKKKLLSLAQKSSDSSAAPSPSNK